MTLSQRLAGVAECVPTGARIVDVGTDHALLPIYLIQQHKAAAVIASDIAQGPVEAALVNVRRFGLESRIPVRLGDGLSTVRPGEVDTVVLAGMGGSAATAILAGAPAVVAEVRRVVVQPMNAVRAVRAWFLQNEYGLLAERVVTEADRHYEVVVADRAVSPTSAYKPFAGQEQYALEFGPMLLQQADHPDVRAHFAEWLTRLENALLQLNQSKSEAARQRRQELAALVEFLIRWLQPVSRSQTGESR